MNSRPNNRRLSFLLTVLTVLVLVWVGNGVSHVLTRAAVASAEPFWFTRAGLANVWESVGAAISHKQSLEEENQDLRGRLVALEVIERERDRLLADNTTLRAEWGKKVVDSHAQVAHVLSGWSEGPLDLLLIDLGSNNATVPLRVGDVVLGPGNLWLGRVVEVAGDFSKVKLLSFAGDTQSAVLGPKRLEVVLEGRGGGNFRATLPRGVAIAVGDEALVSVAGSEALVATVGAVEPEDAGDQRVYLQQPLRASTLPYVEVVSTGN